MSTNSATTLPCAGCSRDVGDVMQPLVANYDGKSYRVCGRGCLVRFMARLSQSSTTSTTSTRSSTNDTVNYYMLDGYKRFP